METRAGNAPRPASARRRGVADVPRELREEGSIKGVRRTWQKPSVVRIVKGKGSQADKPTRPDDLQVQARKVPSGRTDSTLAAKRPYEAPPPTRSILGLGVGDLSLGARDDSVTVDSLEAHTGQSPRKRAAIGDGISAGSGSPRHEASMQTSSPSPPSRTSPEADFQRQQTADLPRPRTQGKQLWSPDYDTPYQQRTAVDPSNIASSQVAKARAQGLQSNIWKQVQSPPRTNNPRQPNLQSPKTSGMLTIKPPTPTTPTTPSNKEEEHTILSQPETRPISQEQLVAEVKGIYAGLVMVEAKCIEVDNKHATLAQADPTSPQKIHNEQWQAIIALHRTLLHEHHDFFLASQHPSASPALRRLAAKYAMPARMWRHGIHSFLELLRHRLPAALDHMLSFIYLAYSMMALLYETVPAFEDTWIECLGDLGRYRMAIEDDDIRDREVWTGVSKHWYSLASDKAPFTGRLYHHLAILARPDTMKQVYYYAKSLCVAIPFLSARESILTVFDPVLANSTSSFNRLPPLDTAFVKALGLLFKQQDMDNFEPVVTRFVELLDSQVGRMSAKFRVSGYQISVSFCCAMLRWGAKDSDLMRAMFGEEDAEMGGSGPDEPLSMVVFSNARLLHHKTAAVVFSRLGDPNVLSFVHTTLVFLCRASRRPAAMSLIDVDFPWEALALFLTTLLADQDIPRLQDEKFPMPEKGDRRPLSEDYALRGLLYVDGYPDGWFDDQEVDDEEREKDRPSMVSHRKERTLWQAFKLVKAGSWLHFDMEQCRFLAGMDRLKSRVPTGLSIASATTLPRNDTWPPVEELSDAEEELTSATMSAADGD